MGFAGFAARAAGAATLELLSPNEPQTVQVQYVDSSCIVSIGWQPPGTITVTFKRGGSITYDYPGDYDKFKQFVEAPSKGAFFNANIK